ncbi:MAG: hypothetical protein AAFY59_07435, partial [Pseudomonadota bacterium]
YQALLSGAQPFIYTVQGDYLCEFAEPLGAFTVSQSAEALETSIQDWQQGAYSPSPDAFLARHLSRDPDEPATERILKTIKTILGAPHPV